MFGLLRVRLLLYSTCEVEQIRKSKTKEAVNKTWNMKSGAKEVTYKGSRARRRRTERKLNTTAYKESRHNAYYDFLYVRLLCVKLPSVLDFFAFVHDVLCVCGRRTLCRDGFLFVLIPLIYAGSTSFVFDLGSRTHTKSNKKEVDHKANRT